MTISVLFFQLAFIFVPGFVWMKIHSRYGHKGEGTQFDVILNVFIFGLLSYAILYLIYWPFGRPLALFAFDPESKKLIQPEILPDVVAALAVAFFAGIVGLYVENNKLFTRFVQSIGATKTYGDEDVWEFVFNSPSPTAGYVHFRDFANRVTYAGYVRTFSETEKLRELVLADVIVYDFDGNAMYQVPSLYLARGRENIHIEFPAPA